MRFAIIGSARTGSSHLADKLRGHPHILCHGEVFHPKNVWVYWPKRDLTDEIRAQLLELKRTNPEALLERVFATDYGHSSVGFKILKGHDENILKKIVLDSSIRKAVLYRRNVLANYSSALAAGRTGNYGSKKADAVSASPKVPFVPKKFVGFHNAYTRFYRRVIGALNANRQLFQFINYEDINDPSLFASLVSFLGADPKVSSRQPDRKQLIKQNPTDILSRFSNTDEVVDFLRSHGLLHWMHEGETSIAALNGAEDVGRKPPRPGTVRDIAEG